MPSFYCSPYLKNQLVAPRKGGHFACALRRVFWILLLPVGTPLPPAASNATINPTQLATRAFGRVNPPIVIADRFPVLRQTAVQQQSVFFCRSGQQE